jgi:hypothetical protein
LLAYTPTKSSKNIRNIKAKTLYKNPLENFGNLNSARPSAASTRPSAAIVHSNLSKKQSFDRNMIDQHRASNIGAKTTEGVVAGAVRAASASMDGTQLSAHRKMIAKFPEPKEPKSKADLRDGPQTNSVNTVSVDLAVFKNELLQKEERLKHD